MLRKLCDGLRRTERSKDRFGDRNFVKTLLDSPARHVVMSLISDICCGRRLISLLALPVSDDFVKIQVRWDVML